MNIIRGKVLKPKKVLIYGPEGIGKTTFASKFPDPLFIDTEGSSGEYDVARTDDPSSWGHLKSIVQQIARERPCKTVVIDTLDWAEKMCIKSVCDEHQWEAITDPGYGNGYSHVFNEFGKLLHLLDDVIAAGIHVVLTAHAALRKFEQPDERGAYDRWALKLIDSQKCSIAHMVMEWCDAMFFANYKTIVITDSKTKKTKAQGGSRVMYTTHHSCWDAKNRYGLPDELPFQYDEIRNVIEGNAATGVETKAAATTAPLREEGATKSVPEPEKKEEAEKPDDKAAEPVKEAPNETEEQSSAVPEPDKRIPKSLRDLMIHDGILEWDIENFAEGKGFVPYGTKIWDYETVNPGIIDGLFVAQWTKVRDQIRQTRKEEEIPFN